MRLLLQKFIYPKIEALPSVVYLPEIEVPPSEVHFAKKKEYKKTETPQGAVLWWVIGLLE